MTTSSSLEEYVRSHAVEMATLDPEAPLDDLEPLRDLIGDARVVAIGENTHHVREFFTLRHRLCRFLVERCGFTHFAPEAPFSEGIAVARWVDGGDGDGDEIVAAGFHTDMGRCEELREHLRWMRERNMSGASPVRYFGIDCPASLASLEPALDLVADFVRAIDPATLAMVERVRALATAYAGGSLFESIPRFGAMPQAARDELAAALSHLLRRFEYLGPHYRARTGTAAYDVALRSLRSAWCLDLHHRELSSIWNDDDWVFGVGSARDSFMAESISWLLERSAPETKVVMAAANAHLQRLPWMGRWTSWSGDGDDQLVAHDDGEIDHFVLGYFLAQEFGDDFVSIAVTSGGGDTVLMDHAPDWYKGLRLEPSPVPAPVEGSIEAALAAADVGLSAVDLRPLRGRRDVRVGKMSMSDQFVDLDVVNAFDAVITVPTTTASGFVEWLGARHGLDA